MHSLIEATTDGKSSDSCAANAEAKSYAEFCSPPFRYSLVAGLLLLIFLPSALCYLAMIKTQLQLSRILDLL